MLLHFPTLGLVLLSVGLLTSCIMIIIWRMYPHLEGPGFWVAAVVLMTLGFIPIWLEPQIGNMAIILNNFASITTPALILEGIMRFRRIGTGRNIRIPSGILYILLYMLSTMVNLGQASRRYTFNDPMIFMLLVTTILVLLWKQKGWERLANGFISLTFALLATAFAIRWTLAQINPSSATDLNDRLGILIYFTLVPWAIGWTYGFVLLINIRGRQELHDAARIDALTGLHNRLWMAERLDDSVQDTDRMTCLVLFDINGFKKINDEKGHLFGDAVLRWIGSTILQNLTEDDAAIRYGGDEFLLLISCHGSQESFDRKLHAIIHAVESPTTIEGTELQVSLSYGTAHCPADGQSADVLLALADKRMYARKRPESR